MSEWALAQGRGQEQRPGRIDESTDQTIDVERKEPGIFHRARMDRPAEQLAYANDLADAGRLGKARRAYLALVHNWHGAPEAAHAQLQVALLLEQEGDYRKAFEEFQYLVNRFAGEYPHRLVIEHQFKIANLLMNKRHFGFFFFPGFRAPAMTIPLFEQLVENAPEWERAPELQYRVGVLYEEDGDLRSAIRAYSDVESRYPDSDFAADAAFRKAVCMHAAALKRRNNEEGLRRAAHAFSAFLSRYSGHEQVETAQAHRRELNERLARLHYNRAVFYDDSANRKHAASMAYLELVREFPRSSLADVARERIAELKEEMEADDENTDAN